VSDSSSILNDWPAELPQIPDLVSTAACYGVGEAMKRIRFEKNPKWNEAIRRSLPLFLPAFGAGVRTLVEVVLIGGDWKIAAIRGAIAGAAAIYAHSTRKATIQGDVTKPESAKTPEVPPNPEGESA